MSPTKIQWTDETWNPTTGCTKVSPGCANCYIERTPAFRIKGRKFVNGATDLWLHKNRLEQPLHWKKPRRVFVNSLSDLFHPAVPDAFIDRVFAVMALCPQHAFQILTKRAERMRDYVTRLGRCIQPIESVARKMGYTFKFDEHISLLRWPVPNVWLGVSVENQHFADERIPLLLQTPAAVRFISAEPLLEDIDIQNYLQSVKGPKAALSWVIVGGESGPRSRPFDVAWARAIVMQCKAAGVACFVKQLGARPIFPDGGGHEGFQSDKKGGDPSEWPADLRVRQFPEIR